MRLLSAPYAEHDPISSWSNSIIILISLLSLSPLLLNSIKESSEHRLLAILSNLDDDTNSSWSPIIAGLLKS
jgi:hypothetical protein